MMRGTAMMMPVITLVAMLSAADCLHAQYERIQLQVYGMDCQLCAQGVAASVMRLGGVKSISINLKHGILDIVLKPDNNFKMSDLRKRIRDNGFRPMEATVTALGRLDGTHFEVLGSGESYEVKEADSKSAPPVELTFQARDAHF